jgi:peptidoglycan/LPS O-acetylase OafA/YrhL
VDFKLFGDRTAGTILGFFRATDRPWLIDFSVITLIGQDLASVFLEFHRLLPVRQAWSVSSELVFYALVPLLFRANPRQLFALVMGALIVKIVVQTQIPSFQEQIGGFVFYGLPIEGWRLQYFPFWNGLFYFCLGFYARTLGNKAKLLSADSAAALKPLALLAFLIAAFFPQTPSWFGAPGNNIWFDILLLVLVVNFFDTPESKLERMLGSMAYHVYLVHYLMIELVNQTASNVLMLSGPYFGHIAITSTVVLLSMAYAYAFEEIAQKRIDRWRRRLSNR